MIFQKALLSILYALILICGSAQSGELVFEKDPNPSSTFHSNEVLNSEHQTHFQITKTGQTIDLFRSDSKCFYGVLTNEISQYRTVKTEWGKGSEADNLVLQKIPLDSQRCTELAMWIIESKIYAIPTDRLIEGWSPLYLHCHSVDLKLKYQGSYLEKNYSCPWSNQGLVPEAKLIVELDMKLNELLELDERYDDFVELLPLGRTYTKDGYRIFYKWTTKETKAWLRNKPKREYLDSIKSAVDSFILMKLPSQLDLTDEIGCINDYQLIFNTKGILKKVYIAKDDRPGLEFGFSDYLEERKNLRRCKREVRKLFRGISLESFVLKYEIHRTLSFSQDDEILLRE